MTAWTLAGCAAAALMLAACSSSDDVAPISADNQFLTVQDREIYLRGEMNDYAAMSTYRLKPYRGAYCVVTALRADWAPYRFKFADENWTAGSNFGYALPPGVLKLDGKAVALNPQSRFEELRFVPPKDGAYRICMFEKQGKFYARVLAADNQSLDLMAAVRPQK